MLVHLHVKNLALIEETEVDFGPGLNILTGETGAGKSILLGSIQLILGAKPSREMIRENASFALVELLFQVENTAALKELSALGIETEDGEILLSRKIMEGRSVSKINGETCTVAQMKKAAALLLDIHGQHEHQSLLSRDKQLDILDEYGKKELEAMLSQVKEAFDTYKTAHRSLTAMDIDEEKRNREIAFLSFEIQEIEEASLKEGEDEELEKQYRRLSNSRRIVDVLQEVYHLTGEEDGASDQTGSALQTMERVLSYDEDLRPMAQMLSEIDGLLSDFTRDLSGYLSDLVFDDEEFDHLQRRLDLINTLKSKYGQRIPDILAYKEQQKKKLAELQNFEENLELLKQQAAKAKKELMDVSQQLSEKRKEYALSLEKQIITGLKELNFLDVRFAIDFTRRKSFSERGIDEIEYQISTNPGESIRPLGKIVSGGELSRIMLAIKAILADKDQIETLIFDEIDTGISGITAQKVSEKMAQIGGHRQVICITHLPQIASMADVHFEIEKHAEGEGTTTQIHLRTGDDSLRELARLLGGDPMTEAALNNAREMKQISEDRKEKIREKS